MKLGEYLKKDFEMLKWNIDGSRRDRLIFTGLNPRNNINAKLALFEIGENRLSLAYKIMDLYDEIIIQGAFDYHPFTNLKRMLFVLESYLSGDTENEEIIKYYKKYKI